MLTIHDTPFNLFEGKDTEARRGLPAAERIRLILDSVDERGMKATTAADLCAYMSPSQLTSLPLTTVADLVEAMHPRLSEPRVGKALGRVYTHMALPSEWRAETRRRGSALAEALHGDFNLMRMAQRWPQLDNQRRQEVLQSALNTQSQIAGFDKAPLLLPYKGAGGSPGGLSHHGRVINIDISETAAYHDFKSILGAVLKMGAMSEANRMAFDSRDPDHPMTDERRALGRIFWINATPFGKGSFDDERSWHDNQPIERHVDLATPAIDHLVGRMPRMEAQKPAPRAEGPKA